MTTTFIQTLLAYHQWANAQVWDCVTTLSDEQYERPNDYSIGSVAAQMYHVLQTDWSSILMLTSGMPDKDDPAYLVKEQVATRDAMQAKWAEVDALWSAFSAGLDDGALQNVIQLPNIDGGTFDATLAELLLSLVNHGTNHRAQVLAAIGEMGGKTVEQGIYFYYMTR